jgi:hypothetical protein
MRRDRDIFSRSQYTPDTGHKVRRSGGCKMLSSLQRHPTALTRGTEAVPLIGFSSAPWARTKSCTVGINHERIYREVKPLFASKLAESEQLQHLTLRMDSCYWAPYCGPNQLFLPTASVPQLRKHPPGVGRCCNKPSMVKCRCGSLCTYVRVLFDVGFWFLICFPKECDTSLARSCPVGD